MAEPGAATRTEPEPRSVSRRTVLCAVGGLSIGAAGPGTAAGRSQDGQTGPVVYVNRFSGIAALDATNGDLRYNRDLDVHRLETNLTVSDGVIYGFEDTGGQHLQPFAIDARTGDTTWTGEVLPTHTACGPTIIGETLYTGTTVEGVHAVDARNGERTWTNNVGHVSNGVTAAYGTLFAAGGFSRAVAVRAEDGARRWSAADPTGAGLRGNPAIVGRRIFYGTKHGVAALDVLTGELEWHTEIPGATGFDAIVSDGDRILAGDTSRGSVLGAVDPKGGELQWTYDAQSGRVFDAPTVADGVVYCTVGDDEAPSTELHAIDASDGTRRWAVGAETVFDWTEPTAFEGIVYIGDHDGAVSARRASTGELVWKTSIDEESLPNPPIVVADPDGGSGVGSRSRLGACGHHADAIHYSSRLPSSVDLSAEFVPAPERPTVADDVVIDASPADPGAFLDEFVWRLDGSELEGTERQVQPSIETPGVHQVELTVVGPGGRTATTTGPLVVRAAEPTVTSYTTLDAGRVTATGLQAAQADREAGEIPPETFGRVFRAWLADTSGSP